MQGTNGQKFVKAKYIIIECEGAEGVIVFSPFLRHQSVAGVFKITSAGFCRLNGKGGWEFCGRSDGLECYPRPQDSEILNRHLLSGNRTVAMGH